MEAAKKENHEKKNKETSLNLRNQESFLSGTDRKLQVLLFSERAVHAESQFSRRNLTARPRSHERTPRLCVLSARVSKQAQNFMRNGLRLCPE